MNVCSIKLVLWAAALALPFTARSTTELPYVAPHFVEAVRTDHPRVDELATTLAHRLQQLVERRVRAYVARRRGAGIGNAAVMVVDTRDMAVRAVLGSADFFDDRIAGQVNGTRAPRSPGSTLKPFVYGLGIEQGLIHPLTLLKDAPASFGGFNPENFDREFSGPVKARDALIRSRNLPAVHVAARLSQPNLYGFLNDAGIAGLREESFYGLALVLGGGEMTMEELVTLYAMLANRGMLQPLRMLEMGPQLQAGRVFRLRPETCHLFLEEQTVEGEWLRHYRFTLVPHRLADFAGMWSSPVSSKGQLRHSHSRPAGPCDQARPATVGHVPAIFLMALRQTLHSIQTFPSQEHTNVLATRANPWSAQAQSVSIELKKTLLCRARPIRV